MLAGAVAGLVLAIPAAASAAPKEVAAAGNPFTFGSLKFDPANVTVKVGRIVRWTNTDDTVPHTATEDHGLWDLTGTYGLPGNMGFGPGESRQRVFEAGTQRYYCKVHPNDMRGVVAVPVTLAVKQLAGGGRRVTIRWSTHAPAADQVYGVEMKTGSGRWRAFRTKTRFASATLTRHGAKATLSFRARLRAADDVSRATGWSPAAKVTA